MICDTVVIRTALRGLTGLVACLALMVAGIANADQTDPRLDALFAELRTGGAINAEANAQRIQEIWADSQSDTVDLIYLRALERYNSGDFESSLKLLNYVRALSPNFMQGYALSGFVNLAIDNQPAALSDFSRALELEPRQFEVRKALGSLLLAAGADRDAYEMLQKGLAWNPFDDDMRAMARKLRLQFEGQEI